MFFLKKIIISGFILGVLLMFDYNYALAQQDSPAKDIASEYVGVAQCAVCHPAEYQEYNKRKFKKAWRVLKMRGAEKNEICLKCHVTGFGKGGFISEEQTPHLVGKQCEACHGPGGKHISNPSDQNFRKQLKVVNKQNICIECHTCMTTHKTNDF